MLNLLSSSSLPYLLFLFLVLMTCVYKSYFASRKQIEYKPPSPWKLPIVGNLHQIGLSPHRSLHALAKKHGSLMLLHFGSKPVLIASSADVAREIMKTHDLAFSSRPQASIPVRLSYYAKDIAFAPYGEHWRKTRSIAVLQLLSNKSVQSFHQVREEETAFLIDEIRNITSSSTSSLVNLSDLVINLTNNVVCRVALGRKYNKSRKFKKILNEWQDLVGYFRVGDFIPWLSWVDNVTGLDARVRKNAEEIDEFLESVVEEHLLNRKGREASGVAGDEVERQDFVDIFLQLQSKNTMGFSIDRDTIKGVILDIFAAGTDTVFTVIEWTIAELLRHPEIMKKLQSEVRGVAQGRPKLTEDDIEKLEYLKDVIKESLRLHAPVPLLVPRESTQEVELLGYKIPAGTQAYINAWAIGRDPKSWEDPEEFKPERFMDSNIDIKGLDFELIPFGAGRRGCPGIKFSMSIIELVLANLVQKFDISLPGGGRGEDLDMREVGGISVHMKSPLIVVATPHSS